MIVKSRDSLLTTSSGYTNYRGLLNLVIILLLLSNARAALENIIKYGILVDPLSWLSFLVEGSKHWPSILISASCLLLALTSFVLEKLIGRQWQAITKKDKTESLTYSGSSQTVLIWLEAAVVVNLVACITLPAVAVLACRTHPISASISLMLAAITFLKLVSYHMMNYWCRDVQRPEESRSQCTKNFIRSYIPSRIEFGLIDIERLVEEKRGNQKNEDRILRKELIKVESLDVMSRYPKNLNLEDFFLFLTYPTMCYELEFPRTERIRKRFLLKRVTELIILSQLDIALIQQWLVPTVSNSVVPFRQMHVTHMLERLLKLAIPNHVIWIIWFYLFFHSLLNIQAELTRFADREFYRDWWNSESVYYFWSHWNIPVHKWCVRHLYIPLMAIGFSKCQAKAAVFFVSAFFHEYLVSVPLKMFRIWAFTGMLMQLPWARFVSIYFNNNAANIAVWLSLILGQPLCIIMYYHDYYVINHLATVSN